MVFTSLDFLFYFPIVSVISYLVPKKARLWLLLLASYFFYIHIKPIYFVLLFVVTLSTYFFTILIDRTKEERRKQLIMIISILLILLPLFFYKYFGPLNDLFLIFINGSGTRVTLPAINYVLPIGISFYTFMAIGYIVDVYNEELRAEKNFGAVALFVSFFPLILSGPIERAGNMLPQFKSPKSVHYDQITQGLKWMLWGYFMKLVVADRLGIYIDLVHNNYTSHNGITLLFASLLYPFQVYGDLGGYSLIAIGTAKVLGFNIVPNFKRPFFATSMSELWNRWHMSLISWLKDYLYTPLSFAMRRFKVWGIIVSLMLTFLISGLWHGASATFVCWGLFQGVLLSIEAILITYRFKIEGRFSLKEKTWYLVSSCVGVYLLFATSLIFARAETIEKASIILRRITMLNGELFVDFTTLIFGLGSLAILLIKDFMDEFFINKFSLFNNRSPFIRFGSYLSMIFLILLAGVFKSNQFIYFKF